MWCGAMQFASFKIFAFKLTTFSIKHFEWLAKPCLRLVIVNGLIE